MMEMIYQQIRNVLRQVIKDRRNPWRLEATPTTMDELRYRLSRHLHTCVDSGEFELAGLPVVPVIDMPKDTVALVAGPVDFIPRFVGEASPSPNEVIDIEQRRIDEHAKRYSFELL